MEEQRKSRKRRHEGRRLAPFSISAVSSLPLRYNTICTLAVLLLSMRESQNQRLGGDYLMVGASSSPARSKTHDNDTAQDDVQKLTSSTQMLRRSNSSSESDGTKFENLHTEARGRFEDTRESAVTNDTEVENYQFPPFYVKEEMDLLVATTWMVPNEQGAELFQRRRENYPKESSPGDEMSHEVHSRFQSKHRSSKHSTPSKNRRVRANHDKGIQVEETEKKVTTPEHEPPESVIFHVPPNTAKIEKTLYSTMDDQGAFFQSEFGVERNLQIPSCCCDFPSLVAGCASTCQNALSNVLQGGEVLICAGQTIELVDGASPLQIFRDYVSFKCASSVVGSISIVAPTCTIRRASTGWDQLLRVTADQVSIVGIQFENGGRADLLGGAVLAISSTGFFMDRCVFVNNIARNGGALYVSGGRATLSNTRFTDNRALSGKGGAVFLEGTLHQRCDNLGLYGEGNVASVECPGVWYASSKLCQILEIQVDDEVCRDDLDKIYANTRACPGISTFEQLEYELGRANPNQSFTLCVGKIEAIRPLAITEPGVTLGCNVGNGDCILDANWGSRILIIQANDVLISGITFAKGSADHGGAIYAEGNNIGIEGCWFRQNKVSTANGYGGAIFHNSSFGSVMNLVRCTFLNNVAYAAPAAYYRPDTNQFDWFVTGGHMFNQAQANTAPWCNNGSFYPGPYGSPTCIKYSPIDAQRLTGAGGTTNGNVRIDNYFDANRNLNCVGLWSALVTRIAAIQLEGVVVEVCEGVYMADAPLTLNVPGTTLRCITLGGCTLDGSSKPGGSSLINVLANDITVVGLNLINSRNLSGFGGGMFVTGNRPNLVSITFSNNKARMGGGLYIRSSALEPQLSSLDFQTNWAQRVGGAFFVGFNVLPIITNPEFGNCGADNAATQCMDGAQQTMMGGRHCVNLNPCVA